VRGDKKKLLAIAIIYRFFTDLYSLTFIFSIESSRNSYKPVIVPQKIFFARSADVFSGTLSSKCPEEPEADAGRRWGASPPRG
jgi:hypothetical protein